MVKKFTSRMFFLLVMVTALAAPHTMAATAVDGKPSYSMQNDSGVYVWRINSNVWHMRVLAGRGFRQFDGVIESDQGFKRIRGVSLESSDFVTENELGKLSAHFQVWSSGQDGVSFTVSNDAGVCLREIAGSATTVYLGPEAEPVSTPVDLTGSGACGELPPVQELPAQEDTLAVTAETLPVTKEEALPATEEGLTKLMASPAPAALQSAPATVAEERKYNPGHYISLLRRFDSHKVMLDSVRPGVVGFLKRYPWRDLEPSQGNYDFSEVESDLALVASQGMQLIIMIEDKTFTADTEKPLPPYLSTAQYSMPNRKNAYTAVRWSPYVVTRLNALIAALGQRFDAHPNFEGIMPTEESAPSVNRGVLEAAGYTPEKYRDAMIEILNGAAQSFPTSRVFWYMNFLPQHQGYLGDIADAVKANGVVLGGPDMLPDDHALVKNTYPIYDQLKGQMPMYGHISGACYRHLHKDASAPSKYWTMDELFKYSRKRMNVNYMFWVRLTRPSPSDAYDWTQALPVIANNPVFGQ